MSKTGMTRKFAHILSFPFAVFVILVAACIGFLSCENPTGTPKGNTFPETRLANLPPNDTIAQYITRGVIPEQSVYWLGDDPDGYIIAYHYTWTTFAGPAIYPGKSVTILNITALGGIALDTLAIVPEPVAGKTRAPGSLYRIYNFMATLDPTNLELRSKIDDSLGTGRVFAVPYPTGAILGDSLQGADPLISETPTKGVFIFDSPADSNLHKFEVSAIDNNEAMDLTPAIVNFWTLPSPGLFVFINSGPSTITSPWVLRYPTDRSPGLTFTFGAIDPSTSERDYSWSVDDTIGWSEWNDDPFTTITAIDFQQTGSDTHSFYLRGRNRWGVISPSVNWKFRASVPPIDSVGWPKKTLVINNCRIKSSPLAPVWMPVVDSNDVNEFYRDVLGSLGKTEGPDYDLYVTSSHSYRFPSREVFASYTSVFLVSEQELPSKPFGTETRLDPTKQQLLTEYLNIGGKILYSGSPYNTLSWGNGAWEIIADDIFHILTTESDPSLPLVQDTTFNFVGGIGKLGYPNVQVDSTKLPPEAMGAIKNIGLSFPRGFGQTIFEFDSRNPSLGFENSPIGVRYLAGPAIPPARPIFSAVYFGFPLYYAEKSGVIATLRKAFEDLNE